MPVENEQAADTVDLRLAGEPFRIGDRGAHAARTIVPPRAGGTTTGVIGQDLRQSGAIGGEPRPHAGQKKTRAMRPVARVAGHEVP